MSLSNRGAKRTLFDEKMKETQREKKNLQSEFIAMDRVNNFLRDSLLRSDFLNIPFDINLGGSKYI